MCITGSLLSDMEAFPAEAPALLEELVHGRMLQAEVIGYEETDGVPYIQLYQVLNGQVRMTQGRGQKLLKPSYLFCGTSSK